jgi:putative phosphoesterase
LGIGDWSVTGLRLLLLADTHVPKRARDLPDQVWAEVDRADVVLHAGDWVDLSLLDALAARARRLVGVVGNNDGPALRARLPEVAEAELGGVRFAVVHETGPATGREDRCAARYPGVDVLVFGHSHIPWDSTAPTGLRLLNPGSPTDRRQQPFCTYLTAVVGGGAGGDAGDGGAGHGALRDVHLHRLPPRHPAVG